MDQAARLYPCDLTDQQWELIKDLVPTARRGGRPRTTSARQIINAVFYVTRTGCAWRYLPKQYPPWQTVYDYFCQWREQGAWRKIHRMLAEKIRARAHKNRVPRLKLENRKFFWAILDTTKHHSIKMFMNYGEYGQSSDEDTLR